MKEPIHFSMEYERDTSMIVECQWAQTLSDSIVDRLKVSRFPEPFTMFYATGDSVEIWENKRAIQWYRDELLKENKKSGVFIDGVVAEYLPLLAKVEEYWRTGPITDKEKLKTYKDLVRKAMPLFSLWYYTVSDDRTPDNIREKLTEIRAKDGFFSYNDVFVKGCVKLLGGDTKYANLVYSDEFPNLPSGEVLKERHTGTLSIDGGPFVVVNLQKFAKEHPEYLFEGLSDMVSDVKEFKGQIAYKGKVTGRVRIVKNKPQMHEVEEGDILVSPMTTPDFLPAMEKAAAFVTNEGGIICHAAIVAREMKKPCVIGTKIATKVLKDGDMVEVDANEGVVRIIKS